MLRLRHGRWAPGLTAFFASAFLSCGLAQNPQLCASCHGADGNSVTPGVPSIAGQPRLFIENQLVLFREELRRSPVMLPIVKGMKDAEIVALANHFSKLPAKTMASGPENPALAKQGVEAAKKLRCGICHTADFGGQNQIPRLAGQREEYLEAEMRAYRDSKRPGGDTVMAEVLRGVPDADIRALAHFLARRASPAPGR